MAKGYRRARNWAKSHKIKNNPLDHTQKQLDKRLPESFDRALKYEDSTGKLYDRLKRNKRVGKFRKGGKKPHSY